MNKRNIAIAGMGAIGTTIAENIGKLPELQLVAVSDSNIESTQANLSSLGMSTPIMSLSAIVETADVIVEALPATAALRLYEDVIRRGKALIALSSGVLLQNPSLFAFAKTTGAKILVPSGAVGGLDALKAAKEGSIKSVRMVTRKAPVSLTGAPHVEKLGINLSAIKEPTMIFEGNAHEAAKAFPANVNVVATVSLAGLGPEKTRIEVWVDPQATQNSHRIVVSSDSTDFEIEMRNFPSPKNPKTSQLAALSVMALLRELCGNSAIGT